MIVEQSWDKPGCKCICSINIDLINQFMTDYY